MNAGDLSGDLLAHFGMTVTGEDLLACLRSPGFRLIWLFHHLAHLRDH
jgi:hypothetical protein